MSANSTTVKVVLLGEGRVGKTSVAYRFVHDTFNHNQQATLQASFLSKEVQAQGHKLELAIWDTAGQERFHALGPIYYRDAEAALLVYDITDIDSFRRVQTWVQELKQMVGPNIVLAIAANKQDLRKDQAVSDAELAKYAASIGALHAGTSAKTGEGLVEIFQALADRVALQHSKRESAPGPSQARLCILDEDASPAVPPKSMCC